MSSPPLTVAELDAALISIGGFEARPRLAIAVSGGADSMALALLAAAWAHRCGGGVTALIVDHGLRAESAAEVATVAGWLAARGIAHAVLRWEGAKPASGIQAAAREARYALLAGWCRKHGVLHLVTAHHRDDQVETHLIRRRAGSGVDGLAAMSGVRELSGCRLVRPLLAVPRARLQSLLIAARQPWLEDPSNRNPVFERSRLRLAASAISDPHPNPPAPAGEGVSAASLGNPPAQAGEGRVGVAASATHSAFESVLEAIGACGRRRMEREPALNCLLAAAVSVHPAGIASLDPAVLAGRAPELVERLLGRLALYIGGGRYPPRRERLARLRDRLIAEPQRARTLGGCRFVPWRGRILVLRELAAAEAPLRLAAAGARCWDRRFFVETDRDASLTLGYFGQWIAQRQPLPVGVRHAGSLPPLVHPVLPALWDGEGLVAVADLGYLRRDAGGLPRLSFRPRNPLTPASFTVV